MNTQEEIAFDLIKIQIIAYFENIDKATMQKYLINLKVKYPEKEWKKFWLYNEGLEKTLIKQCE